jgi:hypothetical protein
MPIMNPEKEMKVVQFIQSYGMASYGNWSLMLMSTIKNGLPEIYSTLDNNKSYTCIELYNIIAENVI